MFSATVGTPIENPGTIPSFLIRSSVRIHATRFEVLLSTNHHFLGIRGEIYDVELESEWWLAMPRWSYEQHRATKRRRGSLVEYVSPPLPIHELSSIPSYLLLADGADSLCSSGARPTPNPSHHSQPKYPHPRIIPTTRTLPHPVSSPTLHPHSQSPPVEPYHHPPTPHTSLLLPSHPLPPPNSTNHPYKD